MAILDTGKARRGRGRPPFVPTDDQRNLVRNLIGYGMKLRQIMTLVKNPQTGNPVSVNTLQKVFREEIAEGRPYVQAAVIGSLFKRATANHPSAVAAAIWFTKAQFGWKSTDRFEHHHEGNTTGVLVAPVGRSPAEWINQQNGKNKKKKPPDSVDREAS